MAHFEPASDASLFHCFPCSSRLHILIRLPSALCSTTLRQRMQLTSGLHNTCVLMLQQQVARRNHSSVTNSTFGKTRPLPPLLLTRSTSTPWIPSAAEMVLTGMHLQQMISLVIHRYQAMVRGHQEA